MQISNSLSLNMKNKTNKPEPRFNLRMQNPIKRDTFIKTSQVNFKGNEGQTKAQTEVVSDLRTTGENALNALEGQIASDGWAGKTADWISGAWNSKNRAHIVRADIETYQQQVDELDKSIKENQFEQKFKEIFKVDYEPSAIKNYNEKLEQFTLATTSHCVAKIVDEKLTPHLNQFNVENGQLKDKITNVTKTNVKAGAVVNYQKTTPKEDILTNFETTLSKLMGGKELLEKTAKAQGIDLKTATDEEKYKAYGQIGEYLVKTTKETAKNCAGGKNLEEIKNEYEDAYQKAYGTENDIQERVNKYNKSQEIGAAAVRGVVRSAMVAATVATVGASGIAGIAVGAGSTFGAKIIAEVTDKATNDIPNSQDLSKKVLAKMAKSAAISSADYVATRGLKNLIPDVETTSEVFNAVANTGKNVAIDTASGMVGEYFKQGKWYTNQIGPRMLISLTFSKLGKDNPVTKQLMSLTKGGVNQAMKKSLRDFDSTKTFINETKRELEENYMNNPEKFSALKYVVMNDSEAFDTLMVEGLHDYLSEKSKHVREQMGYKLSPEASID